MKNIAIMISELNSGGAERVASHLSRILSSRYNVYFILFDDRYIQYKIEGHMVFLNVPSKEGVISKLFLVPKRVNELNRVLKRYNIECVISFLDSPNIVNILSSAKRKIISIRNYSIIENRQSVVGKLTDKCIKCLYNRADKIVAVSKLIERDYCRFYGIRQEKICTIYNPYDFDEINIKSKETLSSDEIQFYSDHFVYVNTSRIMYQKGIWHLLKAFSLVWKKHNDARLVIVGEDFSTGKVEELIYELGISETVLLTGRTANPFKYEYNAQVYVLSSLFEGFPNSLVEAMACGLPVIATDCKSGPREILCQNVDFDIEINKQYVADYGILVPQLDIEENWEAAHITQSEIILANSMNELYEDKALRNRMAFAAKERSKSFSYERCLGEYELILE